MADDKKKTKEAIFDFDSAVDAAETSVGCTSIHLARANYVQGCIPSGCLEFDLITGGGFPPGRLAVLWGPEGGGKSSFISEALCNVAKKKLCRAFLQDAEGSFDAMYFGQILSKYHLTLEEVLGARDADGSWIIKPKFRYYQPDTGEQVFSFLYNILDNLPDKLLYNLGQESKWYYVFPSGREEQIDNGNCEFLYFVDSAPALLPERQKDDPDANDLGLIARMLSSELRLVKTRLAKKRGTMVFTNQTREKPMAFGNPEYEMCGNALRFYSDLRVRIGAMSVPEEERDSEHGGYQWQEEPCWDGIGIDRYKYFDLRTNKNKNFPPFRSGTGRIWFESKARTGYGIDPVYDTYIYLWETGQLDFVGKKKDKYKLLVSGFEQLEEVDWLGFKQLVLDPQNKGALRKACHKQLQDNSAFEKYFEATVKRSTEELAEPDAEESEAEEQEGSMDE